jgi:DNA repair exonuclease SbcCD ATPase subunit
MLRSPRQIEALDKRLAKTEARLTRQNERIASQSARLKRQDERLRAQKPRLDEARRLAKRAANLFEILSSQLGGLEERMQHLTERVEGAQYDASGEEQAQARRLIEDIREEHRRIRLRFGAVAIYEERLRRLESALAEDLVAAAALARDAAVNGEAADPASAGGDDVGAEAARQAADGSRQGT